MMVTDLYSIFASALHTDPRQAVSLARVNGFAGVMFDAYATALSLPDLSQSGRREFRHVLSSVDRTLSGLRTDCGRQGLSIGADVDRVVSRLDLAMETAVGLGAPLMCVDLGPLPEPPRPVQPRSKVTPGMAGLILLPNLPDPDPAPAPSDVAPMDPAFVSQVDAVMLEVGRLADRYGCVVALSSELSTLGALHRVLSSAGCPWFGVDLDPVALLRDTMSKHDAFTALGPSVRHVRVRDAVRGTDHRTRATVVGSGDTNWSELAALLDDAGYHGWFTLDPLALTDRANGAREGLNHLKHARARR